MTIKNIFLWSLVTLLVAGIGVFSFYNLQKISADRASAADISASIAPQSGVTPLSPVKNPGVANPSLTATAALSLETNLVDSNYTLYAKNANMRLPIASLTKLMTAVVVLDHYPMTDKVIIDQAAAAQDEVADDIQEGQSLTVQQMLQFMLTASSNRAAYALAEKMGEPQFVALMNQKAKQLGLNDMFFGEPTGLTDQNSATAEDLAQLSVYIMKNYPFIVENTQNASIQVPGVGTVTSTDKLLTTLPQIMLGKTGFTDDAQQCLLLVVYHPATKDYLVNVLLGSDNRFAEMQTLLDWTGSAYTWQPTS